MSGGRVWAADLRSKNLHTYSRTRNIRATRYKQFCV